MTEKWLICQQLEVKGPDRYQIIFLLKIDLSNETSFVYEKESQW